MAIMSSPLPVMIDEKCYVNTDIGRFLEAIGVSHVEYEGTCTKCGKETDIVLAYERNKCTRHICKSCCTDVIDTMANRVLYCDN